MGATASAPAALRHDSRPDTLRAVPSRPMPFGAPAADSATFLVKFCIAGLVVLIGFIGWALYMLTASKAVPVLPVGQGVVATPDAVAASTASSTAPPLPLARPAATPTPPTPARATAEAPSAVAAAPLAADQAFPEIRRAESPRRQTRRESTPPPTPTQSAGEVATTGEWVAPTRPPASTSSPLYQDPGPPIVQGPGPRESVLPALPSAPTRAGGSVGTPRADPGPPIAEGPGPRYDYSTPGAVGR